MATADRTVSPSLIKLGFRHLMFGAWCAVNSYFLFLMHNTFMAFLPRGAVIATGFDGLETGFDKFMEDIYEYLLDIMPKRNLHG